MRRDEREGGEGRRVQVGCWVELDKTCRHRVGLLTTERAIRAPLDPELIQSLGFGVWTLGFRVALCLAHHSAHDFLTSAVEQSQP